MIVEYNMFVVSLLYIGGSHALYKLNNFAYQFEIFQWQHCWSLDLYENFAVTGDFHSIDLKLVYSYFIIGKSSLLPKALDVAVTLIFDISSYWDHREWYFDNNALNCIIELAWLSLNCNMKSYYKPGSVEITWSIITTCLCWWWLLQCSLWG